MKALEQLERLKRMSELIRTGRTGTPEQLSARLNISRRQLYADLDYCRDLGVDIEYSKQRQTFFYSNGKELEIHFSLKAVTKEILLTVNGGSLIQNSTMLFLCTDPV